MLTSLNSVPVFSSGVTSLVTVLPPSLTRSFAQPDRTWMAAKYTIGPGDPGDHPFCQANRAPRATSCALSPAIIVALIPNRAPAMPASRLTITPAASYPAKTHARVRAEKPREYAWRRTIMRSAPSVVVNRM